MANRREARSTDSRKSRQGGQQGGQRKPGQQTQNPGQGGQQGGQQKPANRAVNKAAKIAKLELQRSEFPLIFA